MHITVSVAENRKDVRIVMDAKHPNVESANFVQILIQSKLVLKGDVKT